MKPPIAFVLTMCVCITAFGCTDSPASPSAPANGGTTISFGTLSADGSQVAVYSESGYSISTAGAWQARTTFGNPGPFIQFVTPASTMGVGTLTLFADDHRPFVLRSIDVYSSITPIPYTISGVRDFSVVFSMSDTLPNTFGNFKTVVSTHPGDLVDTVSIQLTNPSTCCQNPMGVDNIVVSR